MPCSIRPYRRFPVQCAVTYHAGLLQGQGTICSSVWPFRVIGLLRWTHDSTVKPLSRSIAGIFCLLLLAACATSVENLEGGNDQNVVFFKLRENNRPNIALVYLYRPFRFGSGMATPTIFISDQRSIILRNQHHTVLALRPRIHGIETRHGQNWVAGQENLKGISVESGHGYFVRISAETIFHPLNFLLGVLLFHPSRFMGTDFPIELIEEDTALPEIRETFYQAPDTEEIAVIAPSSGLPITEYIKSVREKLRMTPM